MGSAYHRHVEKERGGMALLMPAIPDLHTSPQEADTPSKRETIVRHIEAIDHEIGALAKHLYSAATGEMPRAERWTALSTQSAMARMDATTSCPYGPGEKARWPSPSRVCL